MFLAVPTGRAQTGVGWAGAGVPGEGCATSGGINAQPHEPVCQGLGTGTVLQHPLEGDCPWWQQDIGAPGRFIPRVANGHSRLVLLVRCRRAVVETQHLRVDERELCVLCAALCSTGNKRGKPCSCTSSALVSPETRIKNNPRRKTTCRWQLENLGLQGMVGMGSDTAKGRPKN